MMGNSTALARYNTHAVQVREHRDMLRGAATRATWGQSDYTQNIPVVSAGMMDYVQGTVILRSIQDNQTGSYLLIPDCVVEETGADQLVITDHPVEQGTGAFISDHAYRMPSTVTLSYGWSPGGAQNRDGSPTYLRDLYQACLGLQTNRTMITINTGKRQYKNMLVQAISMTTAEATENVLMVRMDCREILLATVQAVQASLNPATYLNPETSLAPSPQGILQLQQAPTFNYTDGSWKNIAGGGA